MINVKILVKTSCFVAIFIVFLAGSLATASTVYHGNTKSYIFHEAGCRYYDCKKCVAIFDSIEEAVNAGYRACKVCKP